MWMRTTATERHRSPDGRLLLETIGDFDPRDIHEISEQRRAHVRDAATGATLIDLRGINMDSRFEWPAEGGLLLVMADGTRVSVAADGGSWWTNDDTGAAQPIATAQRQLTALLTPVIRRGWRDRWQRVEPAVSVAVVLAILLAIGWGYWQGYLEPRKIFRAGPESRAQPVNAWILHCPAPLDLVSMTLGPDGRLVVPRSVAPAPLAPLGEGRYGDGAIEVAFDGATVRIRRDGREPQTVACVNPAAAANG